jgi:hypothetical protein
MRSEEMGMSLLRYAPMARTLGLVLFYTLLIVGCVLFAPEQSVKFIYTEF